jgi:hypothetical protein
MKMKMKKFQRRMHDMTQRVESIAPVVRRARPELPLVHVERPQPGAVGVRLRGGPDLRTDEELSYYSLNMVCCVVY